MGERGARTNEFGTALRYIRPINSVNIFDHIYLSWRMVLWPVQLGERLLASVLLGTIAKNPVVKVLLYPWILHLPSPVSSEMFSSEVDGEVSLMDNGRISMSNTCVNGNFLLTHVLDIEIAVSTSVKLEVEDWWRRLALGEPVRLASVPADHSDF